MQRDSGSQSALPAGADDVERARNRWIKVCEEMSPTGFAKEKLDCLERCVEINGRRNIPKVNNSGKE